MNDIVLVIGIIFVLYLISLIPILALLAIAVIAHMIRFIVIYGPWIALMIIILYIMVLVIGNIFVWASAL